jgi:CheY-like chemotaxis protein
VNIKVSDPMRDTGRTALVVESDSGTLETCRAALEGIGFKVTAVDSGVAAVSAARVTKPNIVLFALELRDVSGNDLLNWLQSNPALRHSPMIAISALADATAAAIGDRLDGVLRKPVSSARLIDAVQKALQARSRHFGWEDIE